MRIFRTYLLLSLISWAIAWASTAQAACEEKYAFNEVRAATVGLFKTGIPLSESQSASLSAALQDLDLLKVFPRLTEHRQTIHAPFLNRLIASLTTLQQIGRRDLVTLSKPNMDKAEQIFEELCETMVASNAESQEVSQRLVFELIDFSFTNPLREGDAADIRSYFDLSLVFFFLLGLISLIIFCWKAYVLVIPILKNRKSCLIQATLRAAELDVEGHITTLGKEGLRFVPDNQVDSTELYDRLSDLEALPLIEIQVGEQVFRAKMHMLSVESYVSFFEHHVDRRTLNQLYGLSKIRPAFVSRFTIRSNMQLINPKFDTFKVS